MAQNGAMHQLIRVCDTFQTLISQTESDGEGGDQYALYIATIILKLAEPEEKRCYRNRNTSFSAEICWSNVLKYPYFPSKKLRRS